MKRQVQVFLLLLALVAVWVYFTYFYERYPRHDWDDSYDVQSVEPYGLSVLVKVFEAYDKPIPVKVSEKSLAQTDLEGYGNYMLVGPAFYYTDRDMDSLLAYAGRGHTVFIAADYFPANFYKRISVEDPGEETTSSYHSHKSLYDSACLINFYHPSLREDSGYYFDFRYVNIPRNRSWSYFGNTKLEEIRYPVELISYVKRDPVAPNLVRIAVGEGQLILCSTPIVFTNFHLRRKEGAAYAEKVFSWLSPGSIFIDEVSKMPAFEKGSGSSRTPLRFILSKEALRWAWYLLLGVALLFLLFRSKRRQRIIPVLAGKENASLQYIRLVSRLFHKQKNHRYLCTEKMKLFLAFVRNRYRVSTTDVDDRVIHTVAVKSGIPRSEVEEIFLQGKRLAQFDVSFLDEGDVKKFHELTESFYKNCK